MCMHVCMCMMRARISVFMCMYTYRLNKPIFYSTVKTGKHTDPVWQVCWQEEDLAKNLNFFSISSDGRVTLWTMSKSELQYTDVMELKLTGIANSGSEEGGEETSLVGLAGGCSFDFHATSEHLFIVGTEEGKIHKCSKAYNSQYLDTYNGHYMSVYAVNWNKFHPKVFLSSSADWTVKVWDHTQKQPLMSFDLGNAVGDAQVSPPRFDRDYMNCKQRAQNTDEFGVLNSGLHTRHRLWRQ